MSDNIFQEVLHNAKAAEEKYIGPDYPYYKYIKTPSEIGMSPTGSLSVLGKDIDGLVSYVEVLVSGGGKASATGKPLGNVRQGFGPGCGIHHDYRARARGMGRLHGPGTGRLCRFPPPVTLLIRPSQGISKCDYEVPSLGSKVQGRRAAIRVTTPRDAPFEPGSKPRSTSHAARRRRAGD